MGMFSFVQFATKKGTSINDVPRFLAIFDLSTYLVLLYNVWLRGLSWTPLPTLISDVINGRSQIRSSQPQLSAGCVLKNSLLIWLMFLPCSATTNFLQGEKKQVWNHSQPCISSLIYLDGRAKMLAFPRMNCGKRSNYMTLDSILTLEKKQFGLAACLHKCLWTCSLLEPWWLFTRPPLKLSFGNGSIRASMQLLIILIDQEVWKSPKRLLAPAIWLPLAALLQQVRLGYFGLKCSVKVE